VLRTTARAFLTVLLVGVMAGSAVAFALGGGVTPHKTVCIHPIAGSSYQICVQTKPINLRGGFHVAGVNLGKIKKGHLKFGFRNTNTVPIQIKLALVIKTKAGTIKRFFKTFVIAPGKSFTFQRKLKKTNVRAARLTLTITDTLGDRTVITRTVGKFNQPKPKHKK
jgi:hypothetical protein